jgi:hypothetical protein
MKFVFLMFSVFTGTKLIKAVQGDVIWSVSSVLLAATINFVPGCLILDSSVLVWLDRP